MRIGLPLCFRACFKNARGSAARGFWPQARRRGARIPAAGFEWRANEGCGQKNRRPRGFRAKNPLASLRLSHSPAWGCSFVAPRHRFLCAETEPLGFLKHTLERRTARTIACPVTTPNQSLFFALRPGVFARRIGTVAGDRVQRGPRAANDGKSWI